MKSIILTLFLGSSLAIQSFAESSSGSDDDKEVQALMLDSIATLNTQNEARAWQRLGMRSHAREIDDINNKIAQVEYLVDEKADPNWETLSLKMINNLQDPVHNLVLSWNDWYMQANGIGNTPKWDPENNPAHLVKSEVSDIYKAMTKIRMLEKKLSKDTSEGTSSYDWNLLNSLKREVGIPVEFAGENQSLNEEGKVPSTAVAALN